MKLLFVHERFGALAGAESNAYVTGRELKARGHEVAILHGPETGKALDRWRETFNPRFPLPSRGGAAAVREALRTFQPDAVYVHKLPDLEVLEALVDSGAPLARMVHDHDIYCMRSYKYHYGSRKICRRAASWYCVAPCGAFVARNREGPLPLKWVSYRKKIREIELNRRFERMVVVTRYMRDELLRNGFDANRIEIHAPVPPPGDDSIRSQFSDRNLILYVGQIIRGKGVDVLLESLARVKSPFECVILGDGSHRPHCEELSRKLGLSDRVRFAGFVPQEQLKEYFRDCSVVALSSVWPEPIATVGLEVMRYALPVVAFDAGGISDWLEDGHNGRLAPWMDRDRFAQSVDELLRDKELAKRMGRNGLKLVSERYDFPTYIADLERMFEAVCREKAGSGPSA